MDPNQEIQCIVRGRQSGKTTEAIRLASEKWLYIVVPTRQDAERVAYVAKAAGLDIPYPITIREVARGEYSRTIRGFIFDDVDRILESMAPHVPVAAVTITGRLVVDDAT